MTTSMWVSVRTPDLLGQASKQMLDIRWIRENPEALDTALKNRGAAPSGRSR